MEITVKGYVAMIGDKIATTAFGKDGGTYFCKKKEINPNNKIRPVLYATEKGANLAITHALGYYEYLHLPDHELDELYNKARVLPVTVTYNIEDSLAEEK